MDSKCAITFTVAFYCMAATTAGYIEQFEAFPEKACRPIKALPDSGPGKNLDECLKSCLDRTEEKGDCAGVIFYESGFCNIFNTICGEEEMMDVSYAGTYKLKAAVITKAAPEDADFVEVGKNQLCNPANQYGALRQSSKEQPTARACRDSCRDEHPNCNGVVYYETRRWCSHYSKMCDKADFPCHGAQAYKFPRVVVPKHIWGRTTQRFLTTQAAEEFEVRSVFIAVIVMALLVVLVIVGIVLYSRSRLDNPDSSNTVSKAITMMKCDAPDENLSPEA